MRNMTDEEVICGFMGWTLGSIQIARGNELYISSHLNLSTLWEVEERLTDKQWPPYRALIQESADPLDTRWSRILVHATAAQKIKALAAVLREEENTHAKT